MTLKRIWGLDPHLLLIKKTIELSAWSGESWVWRVTRLTTTQDLKVPRCQYNCHVSTLHNTTTPTNTPVHISQPQGRSFLYPYFSMAISKVSFLVTFLVLFYVTQAQLGQLGASRRKFGDQRSKCRIDRLNALRPSQRIESEAGVHELYDENEDQLQCAGVSVLRARIERNGLHLPSYYSSPSLIYVLRGLFLTS